MLLAIFSNLIFNLSAFHFSLISHVSGLLKSRAHNVVSQFHTHFIFLSLICCLASSSVRLVSLFACRAVSVSVVKLNYVPTRDDSMECFSICFKFYVNMVNALAIVNIKNVTNLILLLPERFHCL